MAKFTIYSALGVALFSGTPTFTGTYMKPGMLEFREIGVPTTLALEPGCYVDYTRTGYRYKIYNVPQVKKQARWNKYGGSFIYQSVQLFDASKMLEFCPFRDLVIGDNRIHFSTQPSISTFEGCDGLARRFQACLEDQYGSGSWVVRIATTSDGVTQEFYDLMTEPRDFTVSGVNILQCLDKIYEIWPEVGWVYRVENGVDTIVIGGAGLNANEGTYPYGKGRGLTSLTRIPANVEELANRIFAYGSSRNMLPRWYNSQNIKDAQSVDIQNLMIPVSEWGVTDVDGTDLPDASKAYVEDAESITRIGLRPKACYFDGTSDLPEIYPSIREATIKAVRDALGSSSAKYYPSTALYQNENVRVDRIRSAQASFDNGLAGASGKSSALTDSEALGQLTGSGSVAVGSSESVILARRDYTMEWTQGTDIKFSVSGEGSVTTQGGLGSVYLALSVQKGDGVEFVQLKQQTFELEADGDGVFNMRSVAIYIEDAEVSDGDIIRVYLSLLIVNNAGGAALPYSYSLSPDISFSADWFRDKTFKITLRQLGFDISAQADLGEGKTIAMRSGKCAGRTFVIKSCVYARNTDSWSLECYRSEDESLSQWFPNTDYPVRGLENAGQSNEYPGDEFVLLEIAMPDIYVRMAENKLYQAALELLQDTATERWQYTPEIDAKFMVENNRVIRAGEYMVLKDGNIIGNDQGDDDGDIMYFRTSSGGYFLTSNGERIIVFAESGAVVSVLVDTVVINEGESAIPTYKVTLRDRKRKTWTESESAPSISSKSVSNTTQEVVPQMSGGESFFTLDDNGNVTLKEQYQNFWVPGWLAAGGVGDEDEGDSILLNSSIEDVSVNNLLNGDILRWNSENGVWENGPLSVTVNPATTTSLGGIMVGSVLTTTPTIQSVSSISNRYYYVQCDSTGLAFVNVPWDGGGSSVSWGTYSSSAHTIQLTVNGTSYVLCENGYAAGGGVSSESDPVFTASPAYSLDQSHVSALMDDNYALKTGGSTYNFLVNTLKFSLGSLSAQNYSDGTLSKPRIKWTYTYEDVLQVGNPTVTETKYLAYKDEIPTTLKNPHALTFGNYIYDGSAARTLTAGAIGAVSISGDETITGAKTFSSTLSVNAAISVNGISTIEQNMTDNLALFNYGGRLTSAFNAYGTTINLRAFNASEQANILSVQTDRVLVGSQLLPNYATGINLGGNYSDQRWATIYGLNADLTGNLKMASTSHIDLGPVRIEYDSVNKAIHIKKADANDTNEYGFYCDGFVAAGGVQASS